MYLSTCVRRGAAELSASEGLRSTLAAAGSMLCAAARLLATAGAVCQVGAGCGHATSSRS